MIRLKVRNLPVIFLAKDLVLDPVLSTQNRIKKHVVCSMSEADLYLDLSFDKQIGRTCGTKRGPKKKLKLKAPNSLRKF